MLLHVCDQTTKMVKLFVAYLIFIYSFYIFANVCLYVCFKLLELLNFLLHPSHLEGFSPVCVRICVINLPELLNPLLHTTFVWIRMCEAKLLNLMNLFDTLHMCLAISQELFNTWQSSQLKIYSPVCVCMLLIKELCRVSRSFEFLRFCFCMIYWML